MGAGILVYQAEKANAIYQEEESHVAICQQKNRYICHLWTSGCSQCSSHNKKKERAGIQEDLYN